jgi:hypothetical protein
MIGQIVSKENPLHQGKHIFHNTAKIGSLETLNFLRQWLLPL